MKKNLAVKVRIALRDYAEVLWFSGERFFQNKQDLQGKLAHKKYHEIHDLISKVSSQRS